MKLFNWLLIPSLAVAMIACTDDEEIEGDGHGFDEVTFFLKEVSVDNTSVTVEASVEGNKEATYYCFLTADVSSPVYEIISSHLKTITVNRHILSSGKTTHTTDGLRQGGKKYRYIMTGLLANGQSYNEPAIFEFETKGDFQKAEWSLARPNPENQPTVVQISGIPTDYVYGFMTKAEWDATDIKAIVNADLDSKNYMVSKEDQTVSLAISESGAYVLYAYGIDENAAPTLEYNYLEFTATQIDYSGYEAFLGTWYDANGNKFVISEKDFGASFTVKGFDMDVVAGYQAGTIKLYYVECGTDAATGLPAYLFGIDQDDYLEDASQNAAEAYLLATGQVTENGISIAGQVYDAVYSGTTYNEQIVGLQVLAYDEASGKVYETGKKISLALPVTLSETSPTPPDPGTPVSYEDFLGEWTITRGGETDTWKISQNVAGESYTITGVESVNEIPVAALYDSANKALLIPDQIIGNITDPDLGPMEVSAHGKILYQGKEYYVTSSDYNDPYIIATGVMSADKSTISLTPETVSISDIGELDIIGLQLFGEVLEGTNKGKVYGFSDNYTALPNTLDKVGGGGGGGGDNPDSSYSAFLGNWTVQRGSETDTWTISKKVEGVSYTILGIESVTLDDGSPDESMAVEATFDSATSSMVINAQDLTSWTHSSYGPIQDQLRGNIMKDNKKSSVTGTYVICTGVVTGDGSTIELTPGTVDLSGGGSYDIIGLQFYGKILEGQYAGYSLYYNEDYTALPNTLTKAGANSAPASCSVKTVRAMEPATALPGTGAMVRLKSNTLQAVVGSKVSSLKQLSRAR